MKIKQIRNATLRINFGGVEFLIDPWLIGKSEGFTFDRSPFASEVVDPAQLDIVMPMRELPMPLADVLSGENKIDLLICGGIGGGAMTALAEAGVEVIGGVSGDAKAAVDAYLAGILAPRADFKCNHHNEEGHSCGGHHHEGGHSCSGHCHH